MSSTPLTDGLFASAGDRLGPRASAGPDLEAALEGLFAAARGEHPALSISAAEFMAYLARHLPQTTAPRAALAALDTAALYLCCGCARGDAAAITALDRRYLGKARAALQRIQGGATVADDVAQKLREGLFLPGKDGGEPRITRYGGRGDLGGWLRTVAMRTAFEHLDPRREITGADAAIAGARSGDGDPELALIKAEYGSRFKQAIEEALRAIPEESRRDLRRYYFEGLGVEALAASDGVAVSTVSRRLARARELLLRRTREVLARDLALGAGELDSMLRLIRTQLEITRGAFAEAPLPRGEEP